MSNDKPGVYRSDVEGHVLVLKLNPVSVTCIVCIESCNKADFKFFADFEKAAKDFVDKHGALDKHIADSVLDLYHD